MENVRQPACEMMFKKAIHSLLRYLCATAMGSFFWSVFYTVLVAITPFAPPRPGIVSPAVWGTMAISFIIVLLGLFYSGNISERNKRRKGSEPEGEAKRDR